MKLVAKWAHMPGTAMGIQPAIPGGVLAVFGLPRAQARTALSPRLFVSYTRSPGRTLAPLP